MYYIEIMFNLCKKYKHEMKSILYLNFDIYFLNKFFEL